MRGIWIHIPSNMCTGIHISREYTYFLGFREYTCQEDTPIPSYVFGDITVKPVSVLKPFAPVSQKAWLVQPFRSVVQHVQRKEGSEPAHVPRFFKTTPCHVG